MSIVPFLRTQYNLVQQEINKLDSSVYLRAQEKGANSCGMFENGNCKNLERSSVELTNMLYIFGVIALDLIIA